MFTEYSVYIRNEKNNNFRTLFERYCGGDWIILNGNNHDIETLINKLGLKLTKECNRNEFW